MKKILLDLAVMTLGCTLMMSGPLLSVFGIIKG
jgi:hypothetical protein